MKTDLLNLGALTCIQASNALAPLVIFPFLLHTLGSAAYADLAFAESLSLLILSVVIFSFEVIGVSQLVHLRHNNDKEGIDKLFSSVLYIRLTLFAFSSAVIITLYTLILGKSWAMICLWTMVPLAYIFQSTWLFQGYERNIPLAIFTVVSRLVCICLIFLFVRDRLDGHLVPAIMGSTYLLGGLASFGYAVRHYRLHLRPAPWRELVRTATEGKEVFLSNIAVSLQRDFNVVILGLVGVPAHSLAAYSVAEKLTKSLQAVARPLNQLFFPKAIRAIRDETTPTLAAARKIFRQTAPQLATVALMLIALTACYFVARRLTPAISAYPNIGEISAFLVVMAPTVAFGVISFMFGSVGLNYLGGRKSFLGIILVTGTTSAAACFVLSHWIGASAAAYCYAAAEVVTALLVVSRYRPASKTRGSPASP